MRSEWNFDETLRGTMRGGQIQLDLAGLSDDDDEDEDEDDEDAEVAMASWRGGMRTDSMRGLPGDGTSRINVSSPLEMAFTFDMLTNPKVIRGITPHIRAVISRHSFLGLVASNPFIGTIRCGLF